MGVSFFLRSIGLGAGLAMDACAASMTNGLNEPEMRPAKVILIAVTFALFQAAMPLIGYFVGHAIIEYIQKFIGWFALALLGFLGGKMLFDGVKEIKKSKADGAANNPDRAKEPAKTREEANAAAATKKLTVKTLLIQAVATSIDAMSVGLTFSTYTIAQAFIAAAIIAIVTFGICAPAVVIGKKFGDRLGNKAIIAGGIILIAIGLEICLTSVL